MEGTIAWAVRTSASLPAMAPPAPPPGPGVCSVCRGWARPGYEICYPCALTMSQVTHPCGRVAVMCVYRAGAPMHTLLRDYKDGAARTRAVLGERVAALAGRFLWRNGPRLAPEGWDAVAVIPSTAGREGPHPLEAALARSSWLAPQLSPGLLRAGSAAGRVAHRRAGDAAFAVAAGRPGADGAGVDDGAAVDHVLGLRVLLVDDTWTTGARAQSAASALTAAGATVAGIAVLGRIVTARPDRPSGAWWDEHCGPLRRTAKPLRS
ncbi:MAG TPA: hypothetical protein VMU63_08505 [Acidimicrobiales bacterium]|nr:hypothetical protein [Acidimicrobiales bacterium]